MNASIQDTLQQSLRDACLAMYLEDVAKRDPNLGNLLGRLTKPEDVYEYLLVDPLVEPAVQTSRGALAVASLQQYVNGIILGMEPGYEAKLSDGPVAEWRDKNAQYPLWAANMMLESYPEAYIDPTLRLHKSGYFEDLEQTINQAKINTDTVGDAVLDYLSKFEEVANLKVINGYIANHEMAEGTWYFLGKPRTELTKYYWRSVDMTLHADGVQDLAPGAWSDWEPVDFPVVEGTIIEESSIRPVFFNNRLYVVWAEKRLLAGDTQVHVEKDGDEASMGAPPRTELALKMIYRRYDGTWSTPFTYARTEVDDDPKEPLQTIALYDVSMKPYRLIIGMYYGFRKVADSELGVGNACAFMRNVQIDQSFNVKRVFPVNRDDMAAAADDTQMGFTEKYIRAVYHYLLVMSGKLAHPSRTILVAETALIKSEGLTYDHGAIEETFGSHFPGVLNKFDIRAANQSGLRVNLSASILSEDFDWFPDEGEVKALRVSCAVSGKYALEGVMERVRTPIGFLMWTFTSGSITIQAYGQDLPNFYPLLFDDAGIIQHGAAVFFSNSTPQFRFLYGMRSADPSIDAERLLSGNVICSLSGQYPSRITASVEEASYRAHSLQLRIIDRSNGDYSNKVVQRGHAGPIVSGASFLMRTGPEDELIESYYTVRLRALDSAGDVIAEASRLLTVTPGGAKIEVSPGQNKGIPPYIAHLDDPNLGTAEYIEFTGSEMEVLRDDEASYIAVHASVEDKYSFSGEAILYEVSPRGSGNWELEFHTGTFTSEVFPEISSVIALMMADQQGNSAHLRVGSLPLFLYPWIPNSESLTQTTIASLGEDALLNGEVDFYLSTSDGIRYRTQVEARRVNGGLARSRRPIRMNTLFTNALINKANQGLEHLLQWSVQQMPEPPMAGQSGLVTMDFNGANGLYFWELFFHLPFLASYRLNREQSHADAESWLRFIFNHTDKTGEGDKPPYWNVVPLVSDEPATGRLVDLVMAASDPDVIAAAYPVHYRKAIFLHFIRNLIDRGDLAYRQQTPDSLTEAKQWYVHAADLLGPAPDKGQVSQWTPRPLHELALANHPELRAWEREQAGAMLCIPLHGRAARAPRELNPHFKLPLNETMIQAWRTVATRLYNLRHSLTLDGKPMSLPLFAPPLDPKALQASRSQAGSGSGGAMAGQVPWPHFRFGVIQERAHRGVDTLITFGNTVQVLIERQERAKQEQLHQAHLWEMSDFVIAGHTLNIDALEQGKVVLQRMRDTVEVRRQHYLGLYEENVSAGETASMVLMGVSKGLALKAGVAYGVAYGLRILPNTLNVGAGAIAGMAGGLEVEAGGGGFDAGSISHAVATGLTAASQAADMGSTTLAMTEGFRRRRQEWALQHRLAESELVHLDAQLTATDLQIAAARHMKQQAIEERARQKTMLTFLTSRFTSDTLYQWLLGQLCAVYFQTYDLVLGLCMTAEAACQYETGDYATRFIRPGGWNDTWRGLTVGENLKLDLLRMDSNYLAGRPRELEIARTVSLRTLFGDDAWQDVLDNLRGKGGARGSSAGRNGEAGKVTFELSERLFDEDYPGMYLRRLSSIGVSIPAVLGAYQDVKAMLSQTASYVIISPSVDAVASLLDPEATPTDQVKLNLRPGQQIAVSHGVDDAGMFALAFQDERYLPFEGTGAVSAWMLEFPRSASAPQAALLDSLTDIILHVRYTARYGGQAFKEDVIALLEADAD